jgi:hypothetical protein
MKLRPIWIASVFVASALAGCPSSRTSTSNAGLETTSGGTGGTTSSGLAEGASGSSSGGSPTSGSTGSSSHASSGGTSASASAGSSGSGSSGGTSGPAGGSTGGTGGASSGSSGGTSGAPTDAGIPLPAAQPIGVDLPDLLWAYLGQAPTDVAGAQAEMAAAVAHGFNHARFVASPFWPTGMATGNGWVANPMAFWAAFDALVSDAYDRGLHLVPSLLWNVYLFPDVAGQPTGDLFTPGTQTRTLAESYVTEVVSRYAASPAILFWEVGNELNLSADIDVSTCDVCSGATNSCGGLAPSEGTPCLRTAADDFYSCNSCRGVTSTQQDLGQFEEAIGQLIQSLDASHPISSGNGYPRPSAYHLSVSPCPSCDWTLDTEAQYQTVLANLTPAAIGVLSVHDYPGTDNERFGDDDPAGLALLATTQAIAQDLGKQLYVGEYGEPSAASPTCGGQTQVCGGDPNRSATESSLDAFVQNGVPYSALWAFDFDQFCAGVPTCYTVEDTETDVVDSMQAHDQAYGSCQGQADRASCPIGSCSSGVCAPVPVASVALNGAAALGSWIQWTNCSGCTPSTFQLAQSGGGGYAELATFNLPCTGSCTYPGAYALSPPFAIQPGHALVRVEAQASAGGIDFNVMDLDDAGSEIAGAIADVSDAGFQVGTVWLPLPAGTAQIEVRLEDPVPSSTLDVRTLEIEWQP